MDTSSVLQTCKYFNITLCMAWIWAPLYFFAYLGLHFEWNQFSSNPSRHASCIHKGLHAGEWPDLMACKLDFASTLGYHWPDYNGTSLADAITQWCPSSNPVLICIIGNTERPLEPQVHWDATGTTLADASGRPLEGHWNTTGSTPGTHWLPKCLLQWHPSAHMGLITRHTRLPLDYYWIRARENMHPVYNFWVVLRKRLGRCKQLMMIKLESPVNAYV